MKIKHFLFFFYIVGLFYFPLLFIEFYPWSHNTMFSKRHGSYHKILLENSKGEKIPSDRFNMAFQANWTPTIRSYFQGIKPPHSLAQFGKRISQEDIREHIKSVEGIEKFFPFYVTLKTFGARDDGSYGLIREEKFHVSKVSQ